VIAADLVTKMVKEEVNIAVCEEPSEYASEHENQQPGELLLVSPAKGQEHRWEQKETYPTAHISEVIHD
jgi:hypothetical protein